MEQITMFDLLRRVEGWVEPPDYQSVLFREREKWLSQNKKYPVIVFYNTGKHLFVQLARPTADSFMYMPWRWVRYRKFAEGNVFMKQEKCRGNNGSKGLISFKHYGHNSDESVGLAFSTQKDLMFPSFPQKRLKKKHLYLVSFKAGRVWRCLAQQQPLPLRLFRIYSYELEPKTF
jgi:hypothetical protein